MIQFLYDTISDRVDPTFTSELDPGLNLFDGNRYTFWKAAAADATPTITFDLGVGKSQVCDYLALSRADVPAITTTSINVDLQQSTDGITWTSMFNETLVVATMLPPRRQDWVKKFTAPNAKRFWRVIFTPTVPGDWQLAGLWLGKSLTLSRSASGDVNYGVARSHAGARFDMSFILPIESECNSLMDYIAKVTPNTPASSFMVSDQGMPFGGRPHFLYDDTGTLLRGGGSPALLNVICGASTDLVATKKMDAPTLYTVGPIPYQELV